MTILRDNTPFTGTARLALLFGSAVIFATMASAGFAEGLYPQTVPRAQTADVMRPSTGPSMVRCTQLEIAAQINGNSCGSFTLSEVVTRMHELDDDDHDE